MSQFKDRSRRLARESYWETHDRDTYECPDCGRGGDEIRGRFEVHHKNGEPLDNRPENRVALCRVCHNLREDKKPSIKEIRHLRSQVGNEENGSDGEMSGTPSVYLAGSMDDDSAEHDTWRASVAECGDRGTSKYTGSTPLQINSPTEVSTSHGCGVVKDIAGRDMGLVDESDAVVAYFDKEEQVGTLTELVYAVTEGKPALVLFDRDLVPHGSPSGGVVHHHESRVYWFLINFLAGDGWGGLEADVTVRTLDSRGEIKEAFRNWDWHDRVFAATTQSKNTVGSGNGVAGPARDESICEICGGGRERKSWVAKGTDAEKKVCRGCAAKELLVQMEEAKK